MASASIERISANTSILTKRICSDSRAPAIADEERTDHEGQQLVAHEIDAHHARGDVVVADRDPGAPDARAQKIERGEDGRDRASASVK